MRQPFCRLVAGFLTGLCQRLSVGTVETLTLTALLGDEGPESISKGFPVLLHPVFHHVGAVRTSLRVAVDSVYELAPSVAHFFLNLEPCHLDVLPPALVDQLSEDGRMLIPVGTRDSQRLVHVRRVGGQVEEETVAGECRFVPLLGRFAWAVEDAEKEA